MKLKLRFIVSAVLFTLLPGAILFLNDLEFVYKTRFSASWMRASMYSRTILFPLSFCAAAYFLTASVFSLREKEKRSGIVLISGMVCLSVGKILEHLLPGLLQLPAHASHVYPYMWISSWMWILILSLTLIFLIKQKHGKKQ